MDTATREAISIASEHTREGALAMLTLPAAELAAELARLAGGTVELPPHLERIVRTLLVAAVLRG